jgi:DNA-binding NarL/FixJ family response regulator
VIRVLLAEDADDMRMLLRLTLESDGRFKVIGEAADGARAIEFLESESPDVVVLDMAMPKMDGLEVLEEIKSRGLRAKVLVFSGFDGGVERAALALGAHAFLRKGTAAMSEIIPNLLALAA